MSKPHKNALESVSGLKAVVESMLNEKMTKLSVTMKFKVTSAKVRKLVNRYVSEGKSGFESRSSCPLNSPRATPPETVKKIITTRNEGKQASDHIARKLNKRQSLPCSSQPFSAE